MARSSMQAQPRLWRLRRFGWRWIRLTGSGILIQLVAHQQLPSRKEQQTVGQDQGKVIDHREQALSKRELTPR